MKKLSLILVFMATILTGNLMAQSPNLLNFQGVARNAAGVIVTNKPIKVRVSIRQGSSNGAVQYSETRTVNTNVYGNFAFEIGSSGALSTTGSLSGISWSNNTKHLQVEIDPNNGTTFSTFSNQQLTTNPFAKHADVALNLAPNAKINLNQFSTTSGSNGKYLRFDGTNWAFGNIFTQAGGLNFPLAASANVASPGSAFTLNNNGTGGGMTLSNEASGNAVNASSVSNSAIFAMSSSTAPTVSASNSSSGASVSASSATGTALRATATATGGKALDIKGKIKLAGGNMNPKKYARLTSDASGNAVWKGGSSSMAVGFGLFIPNTLAAEMLPYDNSTNPEYNSSCKCFTVPASGVYQISAGYSAKANSYNGLTNTTSPKLKEASSIVRIKRNGTVIQTLLDRQRAWFDLVYYLDSNISSFVYLKQGDVLEPRIYVESVDEFAFINSGGFSFKMVYPD